MKKKIIAFVVVVALIVTMLPMVALADENHVKVSGQVTDNFEQPIAGATVKFSTSQGDVSTETDKNGNYSINVLKGVEGTFTVFVQKGGYDSYTKSNLTFEADFPDFNIGLDKEAQTYTVTFDTKGGTPEIPSQTVQEGGTATKPDDPVKPGYVFDGWFEDLGGGFGVRFDFDSKIIADTKLFATWTEAKYTVTVNETTGGTVTADKTEAFENETVSLTVTPDSGFSLATLTGVKDDGSTFEITGNNFAMPASNVTVKATFNAVYPFTDNADKTGVSYVKSSGKAMTVTCSGDYSKFQKLFIDGEVVDSSKYTVAQGSTIVTLKADYLNTLTTGKHILKITYTDGESAPVEITIQESSVPKTGDETNVAMMIGIIAMAAAAVVVCGVKFRRQH